MAEPALQVTITPPLRDLQGKFAKAEKSLLKLRRDMLRDVGRKIVAVAKEEAPKGETKKFSQGIGFKTYERGTGGEMELRVTDPQPLGTFIREGTAAHPIEPVRAKCLHFFTKDGTEVFTKHVDHPGTKPNPYHERALKRIQPWVDGELAKLGRTIVQELAGG